MKRTFYLGLLSVILVLGSFTTKADTLYVTTLNDGFGSKTLNFYQTLRRAVNESRSGDTIIILPTGRLTLTNGNIDTDAKSLTIEAQTQGAVTIDANHNSRIFHISGNGSNSAIINLKLKNLKLVNGKVTNGNGGAVLGPNYFNLSRSRLTVENCEFLNNRAFSTNNYGGFGGAIHTAMSLTVKNSKFHLNQADNTGGAIRNMGGGTRNSSIEDSLFSVNSSEGATIEAIATNLTLRDTTVHNNTARGVGGIDFRNGGFLRVYDSKFTYNKSTITFNNSAAGAIAINGASSVLIDGSQFYNNSSNSNGGAISLLDANTATIRKSALHNNQADLNGGAIYIGSEADSGTFTIENTTVSTNTSDGSGGGIYKHSGSDMPLKLHHATVAFNQGSSGGGIHANYTSSFWNPNQQLELWNTIVTNNTNDDCNGRAFVKGDSLFTSASNCAIGVVAIGAGNIIFGDPQLRPLDYYNSPTKSHALWGISNARDAARLNCVLRVDQRDASRPDLSNDGRCDIGAHENHTFMH